MEFLTEYGYLGMFVASFIAGSVFPFSSEAIMTALLVAGLKPVPLFVWGTIGNIGGSMFNYWVGSLGRLEWIERYLHVKREKVESTRRFMADKGAWIGVLCFLPVLGSAIAVTLGFMRANAWKSLISISIGKALRYALLIMAVMGITSCGTRHEADGEHSVMVSIEPLRWAAGQLADSTLTVSTLVPRGGNPETYEPTAQEMMRLSKAGHFFHTGGLGFELSCMERMRQNAPNTVFVCVGKGSGNEAEHHGHHHDPHIWASPKGMGHIIAVMAAALGCEADTTAVHRADSLMRQIPRGTPFAIYHPSLTQLAEDYGLRQICIEADGKEPSPAQLAQTIDLCRKAGVGVVFVQQEFDRRGAEQIARQIGARVVSINPLGADWPSEIQTIHRALMPD